MNVLKKLLPCAIIAILCVIPMPALAGWGIIDSLNLAPFVPIVLDAMMMVATGGYEFFVGNGNGIIYMMIWGFLVITISLYLISLFFPKSWAEFFGFSGSDALSSGKAKSIDIIKNVMKPCLRGILATAILLQIKPTYITQWLINPFLQFGAIYTSSITNTINSVNVTTPKIECPPEILEKAWISRAACEFLVQPVADLSAANNQGIKRGFEFMNRGLRGLITPIPHGGEDFLNVITGLIMISTFFSSNLFMALLVIQGIFNLCMSLILYPFQVLAYVAKPSDKWLDIWPAFSGITKALQQLIVTMIACAFILCINMAIIKSLFRWNSSVFVASAGGAATSNVPQMASGTMGFGEHSILWLSSILTFYVMFKIFELTRQQLMAYTGDKMDDLHKHVIDSSKKLYNSTSTATTAVGKAMDWIKQK